MPRVPSHTSSTPQWFKLGVRSTIPVPVGCDRANHFGRKVAGGPGARDDSLGLLANAARLQHRTSLAPRRDCLVVTERLAKIDCGVGIGPHDLGAGTSGDNQR